MCQKYSQSDASVSMVIIVKEHFFTFMPLEYIHPDFRFFLKRHLKANYIMVILISKEKLLQALKRESRSEITF